FEIDKRIRNLSFKEGINNDLLKWLEKMNLIGWETSHVKKIQDYNLGYNGIYFDAVGYTYLRGLYRTNQKETMYEAAKDKKGSPVLIESILHRNAKYYDIISFITRVDNLNGPMKSEKNLRIIPVCFVDTIEKKAYDLARQHGLLIIKLSDVFGTKLAQSLQELQN